MKDSQRNPFFRPPNLSPRLVLKASLFGLTFFSSGLLTAETLPHQPLTQEHTLDEDLENLKTSFIASELKTSFVASEYYEQARPQTVAPLALGEPVADLASAKVLTEGRDLTSLLQTETTRQACINYWQTIESYGRFKRWTSEEVRAKTDAHTRVLCGKYLFTYGTPTSNAAVPESFVAGATETWPDLVGPSFAASGLIPNPDDPGFPVGMGKTRSTNGLTQRLAGNSMRHAATCSMCHFGALPDGRYAYGMPNDRIHFGKLAFAFSFPVWMISQHKDNPNRWLPEVAERMRAMQARAEEVGNPAVMLQDLAFIPSFLPIDELVERLLSLPDLQLTDQRDFLYPYAGRGPAFYIAMGTKQKLSLSIPSLWDITSPEGADDEIDRYRLGAFVHSPSLETHVIESLLIGAGDDRYERPEWTIPVTDFIREFSSPVKQEPRDEDLYRAGEQYFADNCSGCHFDDNGGSGLLIPAEQMNIDARYNAPYILHAEAGNRNAATNFARIKRMYKQLHPNLDWNSDVGVRVRRVKGAWAKGHLTSNGAVLGLESMLCVQGQTRSYLTSEHEEADSGHSDLCTNHALEDREALYTFLSHWD